MLIFYFFMFIFDGWFLNQSIYHLFDKNSCNRQKEIKTTKIKLKKKNGKNILKELKEKE